MPGYIIRNDATGEVTEIFCSYDEMKELVNTNPDLTNIITAPDVIGGLSKDAGALPETFKDTLREIKKKHPLSSGVDHLV